jgi:hypothetical protein
MNTIGSKIDKMTLQITNIFHCKNLPKIYQNFETQSGNTGVIKPWREALNLSISETEPGEFSRNSFNRWRKLSAHFTFHILKYFSKRFYTLFFTCLWGTK